MSKNINLFFFWGILLFSTSSIFSQENTSSTSFEKGKKYILGGISVVGSEQFSEKSVKLYSGLKTGQQIKIPGDKLSSAIKKLYKTKRFSSVDTYITKIDGNTVYLEFKVTELPQLNTIEIVGLSKKKGVKLRDETELTPGAMLTDNLLITTKNYIKKKYTDKGYLNTKVNISTKKDTTQTNAVNMLVYIDKGSKIKIKEINFHGNKEVSSRELRSYMKNTKRKFWGRFWKTSKLVKSEYEEDLQNIIDEYSEQGFRDSRIISDEITFNEDGKTINLDITIQEGQKYYFGDIKFLGNSKFSTEQLHRYLRIEEGDVYNAKILNEKVKGDNTPDSQDISSLYQNNGYLFSQVNVVETKVEDGKIAVEIRIHEDDPAKIRKVTVSGNEVTNDHVIYRELRTRPGNLYSKEDIIRSIREISQLGFFDPENVTPNLVPNYVDKTVDINYSVVKKGSSQVELQGGYGGGSFIGTLGLSFNNFSVRNLFNPKEYKPLPMGDGQSVALRLQFSRFNHTLSLSFSEPWLGGKKPKSFSFSIYKSKQYNYDYRTGDIDKSKGMDILGLTLGLGQRLKWPDDYFTLNQVVSYKRYSLEEYFTGGPLRFENGTGVSNNLSYSITLGRNSSGPNRIFPTTGSDFSISAKLTLPYSLINGKDYSNLENDPDYQETITLPDGTVITQPNEEKINQEKFRWLEYYKLGFKGKWFNSLIGKLVLMTNVEFGYLGTYNPYLSDIPFERYFVGGDGLQQNQFDGREVIGLRGYENARLSRSNGGTVYDKFTAELRYPITLKPSASIYALGFVEAGNSYQDFSTYYPFDLKRSAGLGIRIFMPAFGLLGIDFGYGFDPAPGEIRISGWQTHFIIGQQF